MKRKKSSAFIQVFGVLLSIACLALFESAPTRAIRDLPSIVRASDKSPYRLYNTNSPFFSIEHASLAVSDIRDERLSDVDDVEYTYRLFGVFPLKTVTVIQSDEVYVIPGGSSIGIAIRTKGVLVVGLSSVETTQGPISPGSAAGLIAGDVIISADGTQILDASHLSSLCKKSDDDLSLVVDRNGTRMTLLAHPVRALDGQNHLGIWARDSTAGVGTLSFCDVQTGWFAALGHPVSDVDTHSLLSVREGKIVASEVVDVIRGEQGTPGELLGVFSVSGQQIGQIFENTEYGIYGKTTVRYDNPASAEVPVAMPFEAHVGAATLLTTISGEGVQAFSCEIVRVSPQSQPSVKGMVVAVTDEALLEKTGGIVQGMSGSPVLQDGKLVGVVTHVFVNDPTKGYCIYAEWMREGIRNAVEHQ